LEGLDHIGRTPLIEADGLLVKLECANPGGSVKDRIARFMVLAARGRGELRKGDTIVEATSGNTGIALAMVGRALGHPVVIYMPEHMSVERRRYIEALGAEVRLTPREQGFEGPIAIRDRFRGEPGFWVPDQFTNPDNVRCHYETTGAELVRQLAERGLERLDAFVAGVGTGGTLMGVGRRLREVWPALALVAVEPSESNALCGGPAGEHEIQGIGDGFVPPIVEPDLVDEVLAVPSAEARRVSLEIKSRHGHCVGMSAGANTAAARRLQERGPRVLTLWPDCSDRYGSLGLDPPSRSEGTCPRREACVARAAELLG
jgi:cysteine synthase A